MGLVVQLAFMMYVSRLSENVKVRRLLVHVFELIVAFEAVQYLTLSYVYG